MAGIGATACAAIDHRDRLILATLIAGWALLYVLIGPSGEFPLNDDWVYALAVRSILETGRFALPSPASANVVAQAYWGALFCWPFGFSFAALRVSTFVLGGAGILALYNLIRELGSDRRIAAAAAVTLALNPVYLALSVTFMTDVPFTALCTLALWLYVRGVKRERAATLGAAFAFAFLAILVRQFALVLLLAFGCAHVTRKGIGPRASAVAIAPILAGVAVHLAYGHWLIVTARTPLLPASIASLVPEHFPLFLKYAASFSLAMLPNIGVFLAPFFVYIMISRGFWRTGDVLRPALAWWVTAAVAIVLAPGLFAFGGALPALGNVLVPSGIGPLTLRDTHLLHINAPVVPAVVTIGWSLATDLGVLSVVAILIEMVQVLVGTARIGRVTALRRAAWPQVLFLSLMIAYVGCLFVIGNHSGIYDRYLLFLVPAICAILVLPPRPLRHAWTLRWRSFSYVVMLAIYGAFGIAGTRDYFAWSAARWEATDSLFRAGVPASRIDGGYEFNGWYLYDSAYLKQPGKSWWWVEGDDYVIASGPLGGYEEVKRIGFSRWIWPTTSSVLILRRSAPSPP